MTTKNRYFRPLLLLALGSAGFAVAPAARASTHVGIDLSVGVPLPHGYAEVHVGRDRYYYHRGVFYRPGPRGYYVVRAPRGAYVRMLPPHYARVYVGGVVYYRFDDVWYRDYRDGYVVVEPPATVVTSAPATVAAPPPASPAEQSQTIWVGDVEYTFKDGQFFRKNADGLVWTPAPLGAVTKSLPADARSVWYQEVEYFECEDVYFKKTPEGYRVVEAPWKGEKKEGGKG